MGDPGRIVCTAGPCPVVFATIIPNLPAGVIISRRVLLAVLDLVGDGEGVVRGELEEEGLMFGT